MNGRITCREITDPTFHSAAQMTQMQPDNADNAKNTNDNLTLRTSTHISGVQARQNVLMYGAIHGDSGYDPEKFALKVETPKI